MQMRVFLRASSCLFGILFFGLRCCKREILGFSIPHLVAKISLLGPAGLIHLKVSKQSTGFIFITKYVC